MSRTKRNLLLMALGALQILTSGCDENERVARVATQAADRQAAQNHEMARLNREVAEGTRRLVEADAVARKDMLAAQHAIQAERTSLNEGFHQLEAERKQMAQHRRTESVVVPAMKAMGVTIFAAAVVVFCLVLLFGLRSIDASAGDLNDLLIHDLVREQPRLLKGPILGPATENRPLIHDSEPPSLSAARQITEEATPQGDET